MSLADENWSRSGVYEVYAAFLKAERSKYEQKNAPPDILDLIDRSDLSNTTHQTIRADGWVALDVPTAEAPPSTMVDS